MNKLLERALEKWWDDTINVTDLAGSLTAALAAEGLEMSIRWRYGPRMVRAGKWAAAKCPWNQRRRPCR